MEISFEKGEELLNIFLKDMKENKVIQQNEDMTQTVDNICSLSSFWIEKYKILLDNYNQIRKINYTNEITLNKNLNNYNIKKNLLLNHIKDGYKLIHYIREIITKQTIIYNIMISSDAGKQYHILEMDMETLLEHGSFNISGDKKSDITYSGLDGKLKADYESLKLNLDTAYTKLLSNSTIIKSLDTDTNHIFNKDKKAVYGDVLYNDLYDRYYNSKTNFNRGHIFEIYQFLTTRANSVYKPYKHYKMDSILIKALVSYVSNNTSSIKAGDTAKDINGKIGIQLKNITNASAALINSSSIVEWLQNLNKAFSHTSKEEIKKDLEKLFVEEVKNIEGINQSFDRAFSNVAKKEIENFVNSISI